MNKATPIKTQEIKLTFKQKVFVYTKKAIELLKEVDIDFIFLFLATYLIMHYNPWYFRLIGSIGVMYIYKLIIKDIIMMIMRGKR
jgi:hypothetical protein